MSEPEEGSRMAGKQQMGGQRNAAVNVDNICCCDVRHSWHMLFVMHSEVMAQTDKCTWDKNKS